MVHAPYAIVRPQMQTSLARRQRHRRALGRRPAGRRGTTVATVVGASLAAVIIGIVRSWPSSASCSSSGTYNQYAAGLPAPAAALKAISVRAADDRLRPDRQDRARAPRRPQARARRVRRHPRRDPRRDDRDRGQGLLDQPGVRLLRDHLGRDRHGQRPAARRLDDHPAARPPAAAAAVGVRGLDLRPEDPRDHPVDQADRSLPRRRRARNRSSRPT